MSWQDFPLKGFAPDLPNTAAGTFIVTQYAVPTDRGIGNGPVFTEASHTALTTQSLGGALLYDTTRTARLYVGIAAKIWQSDSITAPTTLTDRSGTAYSATTTDTWSFAQAGDASLAINYNDFLQVSTGAAFAAVGGAPVPKASIMTICGPATAPICMVFDFKDGGTHTYRDGWFASGLGGGAAAGDWTTGTSECVLGRLTDDIPGPITAAIGWRDGVVAFKRTGMYLGTYVGMPLVWSWERLSSDIGCIGKNAICRANDVVYWADEAGVWKFDGSYPQKVQGLIHNYWAVHCAAEIATDSNRNFFRVMWDKPKHLLWVLWGRNADSTTTTDGTNTWDLTIGGLAYNTVSGLWTQQGYNPFSNTNNVKYAVEMFSPRIGISNNKKFCLLTWTAAATEPRAALLCSWVFSDRVNKFTLKGLRPQWATDDTTANATAQYWAYGTQASLTPEITGTGTSTNLVFRTPGQFDGTYAGFNIGWQMRPTGGASWEMLAVSVDIENHGKS